LKITQEINSNKLSKFIAKSMDGKKAENIIIINLKKIKNSVTDYFVLATGNSNIHIESIASGVEYDVFKKFNEKPWNKEGVNNSEWVLIDFVNVVAHIFNPDTRENYNLEKLWGDGDLLNNNNEETKE
tara:strand:- start:1210 stop:1593 length:384 start_codon:yes stop_codon:yes gene_type:complete